MDSKYDQKDFFTFLRVLIYFAEYQNYKLYRTKLYKLIFLAQLFYFKRWRENLFNQPFVKTFHHIKLKDIDDFIEACISMGLIQIEQESTGVVIKCTLEPINSIYDSKELTILKHICKYYSHKSSKDLEAILTSCESYDIEPGTIINLEEHYHKCLQRNKSSLKELPLWK